MGCDESKFLRSQPHNWLFSFYTLQQLVSTNASSTSTWEISERFGPFHCDEYKLVLGDFAPQIAHHATWWVLSFDFMWQWSGYVTSKILLKISYQSEMVSHIEIWLHFKNSLAEAKFNFMLQQFYSRIRGCWLSSFVVEKIRKKLQHEIWCFQNWWALWQRTPKVLLLCPAYFWVIQALRRAYVELKKLSRHIFISFSYVLVQKASVQDSSLVLDGVFEGDENLTLMYYWNHASRRHRSDALSRSYNWNYVAIPSRLRYAGVVRFLFLFSIFFWLDSCFQICVASANLWWNINKNQPKNWTSPVIGRSYSSIKYIGLPNWIYYFVQYWVCKSTKFEDIVEFLINLYPDDVYSFILT